MAAHSRRHRLPSGTGLPRRLLALRATVVAAARAAGVDAVDHPFPGFRDEGAYQSDFDGKWCIHPPQVPSANAAFAPTPDEITRARTTRDAYRTAEETGVGAIAVDGMLIHDHSSAARGTGDPRMPGRRHGHPRDP
ncbi:hypothetical protein [Streptomyces sp. 4F14]|uniref:hypothetical protein n=1 Tax=Streptomyces sp. 4F14 TaxID=3394380 RepID=UPI003A87BCC8